MHRRKPTLAAAHVLAATLALSALAPYACAEDTLGAQRLYASATGLLNKGLYDLAADEYRSYLDANPDGDSRADALYGLAVCHHRLDEPADALRRLGELGEDPNFPFDADARSLRAHLEIGEGRFGDATRTLTGLLRDHADSTKAPAAAALLVEAASRAGEHELAARSIDRARRLAPARASLARAELFAGVSLVQLQQHRAAAEAFAEAERLTDSEGVRTQARLRGAQASERAGDPRAAFRLFREASDDLSGAARADALYNAGRIAYEESEPDTALAALDRALESDPKPVTESAARLLRGRILIPTDPGRAVRDLERAQETASGAAKSTSAYWLGRALLAADEPARAAEVLAAVRNVGDLEPAVLNDLAVAQSRSGQTEAAMGTYQRLIDTHPDASVAGDAMIALAGLAHETGDHARARRLTAAYQGLGGDRSEQAGLLAMESAYLAGDFAEAERVADRWLRAHAGSDRADDVRYRKAMAVARQGDFDRAEPLLIDVLDGRQTPAERRPGLLTLGRGLFDAERYDDAAESLAPYLDFDASEPARDDAIMRLGISLARSGDDARAAEVFETLEADHADSVHAAHSAYQYARSLERLDRTDSARRAYRVVIDDHGESEFAADSMRRLGLLLEASGDAEGARSLFASAAASGDESLADAATLDRARAAAAAGDHRAAARGLEDLAVRTVDPGVRAAALAGAGANWARAGDDDRALAALEELARGPIDELEPRNEQSAWYELGRARRADGQDRSATEALRRAAAGSDETIAWYAGLELADIASADSPEEARRLFGDLLGEVPDGVTDDAAEQARYRSGSLAYEAGDGNAVLIAFAGPLDSLAARERDSAEMMAGETLLSLGRASQARTRLERAARSDDETIAEAGLLRLGEACLQGQDWPAAEAAFTTHLDRFPQSELWYQARFGQGWARENAGRAEAAIESYRTVVDRHNGPTAARAQFQLGECLFALDRLEAAVRELVRVDTLYDESEWSAAALYEAGRCLEKLGKRREARDRYAEVVERFGSTEWAAMAAKRLDSTATPAAPGRG